MDMPRQRHRDHDKRSTGNGATDAVTIYTCPMHPEVEQDAPGKCPKCGMFLVPKDQASADAHAGHGHAGHAHHDHAGHAHHDHAAHGHPGHAGHEHHAPAASMPAKAAKAGAYDQVPAD